MPPYASIAQYLPHNQMPLNPTLIRPSSNCLKASILTITTTEISPQRLEHNHLLRMKHGDVAAEKSALYSFVYENEEGANRS